VFESLPAAQRLTALWQADYNHVRPRYVTPVEFARRGAASAPAAPALQQHRGIT
jgi:hypothetical protein